jgi:4-hydroxy-tetrahydrodipicolinate reductase
MSISITLVGGRGRMGQTLAASAADLGMTVAASLDMGDDLAVGLKKGDVIIDFSFHTATEAVLHQAITLNKPLVIGTTGHNTAEKAKLRELAGRIPCVWAGNYSIGVNLLFWLTQRATRVLNTDYDVEVVEMHHRFKKDAPSGTAARLLEIILEERRLGDEALRHGREGIPGERTTTEVGVHSLRGGDVIGDHTVMFAALGERLELTHRASDRGIFAHGALKAAEWIIRQPAGLYDMQDVLGLKG